MLHLNTVNNETFELLQILFAKEYLSSFAFAGGTSLALQIGHRKSIDIDLVAFEKPAMEEISIFLENDFSEIEIRKVTRVFIFCKINKIKTDLVNHSTYKLIKPIENIDGIRFYLKEDIAAMKLSAICGRGLKKDFYDIYFLLQIFSLEELLSLYEKKFNNDNSWMVLKNLKYFDDADQSEQPELVAPCPSWKEIKKIIEKKVDEYQFYKSNDR